MNHNQLPQPNPEASVPDEAVKPFYNEAERLLEGIGFNTRGLFSEVVGLGSRSANFEHPKDPNGDSEIDVHQTQEEGMSTTGITVLTLDSEASNVSARRRVFKKQMLEFDCDADENVLDYRYKESFKIYDKGRLTTTPDVLARRQARGNGSWDWDTEIKHYGAEEQARKDSPVLALEPVLNSETVDEMLKTLRDVDMNSRDVVKSGSL